MKDEHDNLRKKLLGLSTIHFSISAEKGFQFRRCWRQMVWQQEKTISLRGDMKLRKTQLSFHLKKMNGNGSQGGKNLEYRCCYIGILC